jgi:hypothetical protein
VELDRGLITAEEVDEFREPDLHARGSEGEDADGVEPVPDADRRRLQIDSAGFLDRGVHS